ncbi:hypothetical protein [Flavobacterium microcysteis]|uniref:Lipoprotein n=1 Tax=Flavobacterium microcysteis TaxID=2596891 RepID=A0A501PYV1_9FLAO|nr:hypothetical protein [Flavobacterium microcysteis]TPD65739.1 hypothetical protein FJA49_16260 [Flavobacterium microcysteis]
MKSFILRSAFALAMSTLIFSCSSDSDSDPAPQECPPGFTGINCQTQINPSKIKITKFRVTFFNNQDNGASWDTGSGPDIFLQLVNGAGGSNIWISEIYYPDVLSTGTNSFEFVPNSPIIITNVTSSFTIYLGDNDAIDVPSNPNDLMSSILFNIYTTTNGFPATLLLTDGKAIPFRVELSLQYEW